MYYLNKKKIEKSNGCDVEIPLFGSSLKLHANSFIRIDITVFRARSEIILFMGFHRRTLSTTIFPDFLCSPDIVYAFILDVTN